MVNNVPKIFTNSSNYLYHSNNRIDVVGVPIFQGYTRNYKQNPVAVDSFRVRCIINDDKDRHNIDTEKMIKKIMNAASYAKISPVYVACIVKQETHFNDKIVISENGKGPLGLTTIILEDLYLRPVFFDKNLKNSIKKYGSLNKLFEAKKNNPALKLGPLGEILYKYKDPESLKKATTNDFDLNLKVGAIAFKGFLNDANGNLHAAFKRYNANTSINENTGRMIQDEYADSTLASYNQAMKHSTLLIK